MTINQFIYTQWLQAKEAERQAVELRRELEDQLIDLIEVPTHTEGSTTVKDNGFKIKITRRLNRRIDADLLQEVAAENGLTSHLGELFRWKPEINKKAWDDASSVITDVLEEAITTSAGRPSFSIELVEEK